MLEVFLLLLAGAVNSAAAVDGGGGNPAVPMPDQAVTEAPAPMPQPEPEPMPEPEPALWPSDEEIVTTDGAALAAAPVISVTESVSLTISSREAEAVEESSEPVAASTAA